MASLAVPFGPVVAFVSGVTSHLAFFRIGEHHLHGRTYILTAIAIFIFSVSAQSYLFEIPFSLATSNSKYFSIWYFTGLYSSLMIFRVFFHPLRNFPGPLGCKISSAWFATYLGKQDSFHQLEKLHQRYGKFLRIGSNDLSITHPQAVQAIYGNTSKCGKAQWYDLTRPMVSLENTRDKKLHGQRRRLWSGAFGDKSLRDYEQRMARYRALLVKAIEQSSGQPMDMAKWFMLYTFDVMGDLAYGSSFQMLETSKEHDAIKLLNDGLKPVSYMLPMWFFRVVTAIPGATRDWWRFIDYCNMRLDQRMKTKPDIPDIMSCLLRPFENKTPVGLDRLLLEGDSQLIVVAGSDTTAATLTGAFRCLAEHPHHIDLLRAEIDSLPRTDLGDYHQLDLIDLPHLNGVINEALRLYPAVPSALQRLTPPEGLVIDGTFIPGNVTVYCPQYVLGRDPDCFVKPNEFIPERWYSRPDLIKDLSGFAPFSLGSYSCIAKPLALLNLRATISRIVADYDVQIAPGMRLEDFEEGLTDHFTIAMPPLRLCLTKRQKV
ncbi:cytochrome P450 [Naviculisporaceae sp. PSN 640]